MYVSPSRRKGTNRARPGLTRDTWLVQSPALEQPAGGERDESFKEPYVKETVLGSALDRQAEEFYRVFSELARGYQFRDRDEMCRGGISVSQCYALDFIDTNKTATMGEVAGALHLDLSTVSRSIDQLVQRKMVRRETDPEDRRITRIRCTAKGAREVATIRSEIVARHRSILAELSPEARKGAIEALSALLEVFRSRSAVSE